MSDIDDILDAFNRNYPTWLVKGLAASPQIKNMEKALLAMSKISGDASSSTKKFDDVVKKTTKTMESLDKISKEKAKSEEKQTKLDEKKRQASEGLKESMLALKASLVSGGVGGAAGGAIGAISKYALTHAKLATTVGIAGVAIGSFIDLLRSNNLAYSRLSQAGILVQDSFVGISAAAANANMDLAEFSEFAIKNAEVLAQLGPAGTKLLGTFFKEIKRSNSNIYKFGYTTDEAADVLSEFLNIQRRSGYIQREGIQLQQEGFENFLTNINQFTSLVGTNRQEVLKTLGSLSREPDWQLFLNSMGSGGKVVGDSFNAVAGNMSAFFGDSVGGKFSKAVQEVVQMGGTYSDQSNKFITDISALNPELRNMVYVMAGMVKTGKTQDQIQKFLIRNLKDMGDGLSYAAINGVRAGVVSGELAEGLIRSKQAVQGSTEEILMRIDLDKKNREQNEDLFRAETQAIEAIKTVINAFKGSFYEVIINNKDALVKLADVLGKEIIPSFISFANLISRFFGSGRQISTTPGSGADAGLPDNTTNPKKSVAIMDYLIKAGKTPEQAAGIVANLKDESDLDHTNATGDNGHAHGLAQWQGPRRRKFIENFGKEVKHSSLKEQLDFILLEMSGKTNDEGAYAAGKKFLENKNLSASESAKIFMNDFERPAERIKNGEERARLAEQFLNQYNASKKGSGYDLSIIVDTLNEIRNNTSATANNVKKTTRKIGEIAPVQ